MAQPIPHSCISCLPPPPSPSAVSGRLSSTIKFKVRDKEHTLGVVQMSLSDLAHLKSKKWHPLQPHRKSHETHGELQVGCLISEYKVVSPEKVSPSTSRTSSTEDLRQGKTHRVKERFSFHRRTPSWGKNRPSVHEFSPMSSENPLTSSDYEIHSKRVLPTFQSDTNLRSSSFVRDDHFDVKKLAQKQSPMDDVSSLGEPENPLMPEVTGISPNEGPLEGNQRVILRGSNLGESRSDIVRVAVGDVDCTASLEYFSPGEFGYNGSLC